MKAYIKKRKAFGCLLLVLALVFTDALPSYAITAAINTNITAVKTPISERSGALWLRSFSGKSISYNSSPGIRNNHLYVVNENVLYELDKQGNILRQTELSASMNSVCYLCLQDDYLYIPLDGGRIQCIQCSSMRSVWESEFFGGQSLSAVIYHDGYLYAGNTKNPSGKTSGTFYCLDAVDGHTVWTYEDMASPGGYYWSKAIVKDNILYFAGDNGILVSHSLQTDKVYDTYTLTKTGRVRCGITYNDKDGALFTASNDGRIYRILTNKNGKIQSVLSKEIVPNAASANCTSTPAIWNNRLYIGSLADETGYINVMAASDLSPHYRVSTGQYKEVKSTPLISTGYASAKNKQTVYVYFTCNALPGGIYRIKDREGAGESSLETCFIPSHKQFCLSSVSAGPDGTLYYSNDSGYLYAVSPTMTAAQTEAKLTVKKPTNIKWKKKKKNYLLSFKKNEKKAQTLVYVRYSSGKWKKKASTAKSNYLFKPQKKKQIWLRLRNRKKDKNNQWIYSAYTKKYRIR